MIGFLRHSKKAPNQINTTSTMKNLTRKIGYGLGDMGTSMFWKIFSYYLPFFYSNVFGLSLVDAGVLVLATRVWDAVSDLMMGVIADRTNTKKGKYRPYLLWFAAPFAICGILLFTTPDFSYAGKLMWACFTYILMMTVYTAINVPYAALLGVITDNPNEKTVYSSFRMFFAYTGSFIALACWEPLCTGFQSLFGQDAKGGWQSSMIVISVMCFFLFIISYLMTKEVVHNKEKTSIVYDFKSLFRNGPWWILVIAALSSNLFNTLRGATVAYFFADVIGTDANMWFFGLSVLFYAGLFLGIGEVVNMIGVAIAVPIIDILGKKSTFIWVNILLAILSIGFFFLPVTPIGMFTMLLFQIVISVLTGILSPLIWSMYADASDYSEYKFKTASTGLIFSSSSMSQKFGGAIGGAAVLWLLGIYGYMANSEGIVQTKDAVNCMWWLMSFLPAGVAIISVIAMLFYPLTTERINTISEELKKRRTQKRPKPRPIVDLDDDFEIIKI